MTVVLKGRSRPLSRIRSWAWVLAQAALCAGALACEQPASVCARDMGRSFGLVRAGQPAAVIVEAGADAALQHVGRSLIADLARVSGQPAALLRGAAGAPREVLVIGELGRSPVIDGLLASGRLKAGDLQGVKGQWEAFAQVVVEQPFKGVDRALVIVGADRRGAVFGAYDLSARMGVSPWHWWADVPVAQQADVFVTAGARRDKPGVKYRGIFINDEAPALSTWAQARFGGTNAAMYAQVFELLLRLKGNYLWPAMWQPRAFSADDPQAMVLADEMGVVMGTSHHEPMMRAHDEWARFQGGRWDYARNADKLREFWRGGIARMAAKPGGRYESLVTIGMRGDGDEPMSEGTATALLEGIVRDQRQIIADVTRQPAEKTPQMWALYKEVQDYHDKGMKVPDDVLLLFCDDNWGQIRRLPERDASRAGGYGVYYHFDYVGGPRNYKWLNTNQIEKTWQQMDLAHQRGADALWIVNVGDIKPMEFPISFFLDMAWRPDRMTPAALAAYPRDWAAATFGPAQAADIGELVTRYSQYAARRKPELVDERSFTLGAHSADALRGEDFGRRVAEWDALEARVAQVKQGLRPDQRDAYFQLVEHPVLALANLYRLYYAVAWNRQLARAGDPRANVFADRAEAAFARDQAIADQYHAVANGKWAGMMLQTHIGYTGWQQPDSNVMPAVTRVPGATPDAASVQRQLERGATETPRDGVTLEGPQFSRAVNGRGLTWTAIPNLGQGLGAVTALPQGRPATTLTDGVRLDYDVDLAAGGDMNLDVHMVPTLATGSAAGVRLAVGLDDLPPQELRLDLQPTAGPEVRREEKDWVRAVIDNQFRLSARFADVKPGRHVVRVWRLDDNAVLQKLVLGPVASASAPPQGAAVTGHYRNLLREVRPEITEADISAKLAGYWQSLFEGDAQRRVVYPAPATPDGPAAYVLDVGNADVRSEGMSYGMMIAVQMGRQAEFNALWNWAATHMRYASGPRQGYFRWQCQPKGCDKDTVPASDGEAYVATALLMASSRWGDGLGLYDYGAQARALLDTMLNKERMNGGVVDGVRSMFSARHGQVVFVPIGDAADFSDPSYHLPAFYELWAQRAPVEDRPRWAEIARISRAYFSRAAHPRTGLTPDYAEFDGRPHVHEGHEDFRYDAFRTAVNWSVDQAWWGRNPAAAGLSQKLLGFFASQPTQPYPHLYTLDGKPLNSEPSTGLIASNAVAALLVEPPLARRFVDDLWALEPPSGQWRYYDGLLQFMALLHVTGRFKAW